MPPLKQFDSRVTKRPERGSHLRAEKLRLLPRGKVSAFVDLVEVDQVAIGASGPRLRSPINIIWKYRDCDRKRDLAGLLSGRDNDAAARAVLPVQPRCRGRGVGQPVERNIVQDVVFRRRCPGIVAVPPLREAGMQKYPRRKAGR